VSEMQTSAPVLLHSMCVLVLEKPGVSVLWHHILCWMRIACVNQQVRPLIRVLINVTPVQYSVTAVRVGYAQQ
jgi:hypothetical protein